LTLEICIDDPEANEWLRTNPPPPNRHFDFFRCLDEASAASLRFLPPLLIAPGFASELSLSELEFPSLPITLEAAKLALREAICKLCFY
jgi:hypothetical protein